MKGLILLCLISIAIASPCFDDEELHCKITKRCRNTGNSYGFCAEAYYALDEVNVDSWKGYCVYCPGLHLPWWWKPLTWWPTITLNAGIPEECQKSAIFKISSEEEPEFNEKCWKYAGMCGGEKD